MITAIQQRMWLNLLTLIIAIMGMSFSVVGEAASHGVAELGHGDLHSILDDHPHDHDDDDGLSDQRSGGHLHHDSANHSHESADHRPARLAPAHQTFSPLFATGRGGDPRTLRDRLERPPKPALFI